jgi:diguanylate cyclase (GGDEF)-like protein
MLVVRPRNRRHTWPVAGTLLGLIAPLGLLVLRTAELGSAPRATTVATWIAADPWLFGALTGGACSLLALGGWRLGLAHDRLDALAWQDPLTGLSNPRRVSERLLIEVALANRTGRTLSLLIVDIDGLRRTNEGRGRGAGDAALRRVARAIRATCRSTDLPARYGGDEFMVLAPATRAVDAAALAERIRSRVEAAGRREDPPTTVSIGIAGGEGPAVRGQDLVASAGVALRGAKDAGSNRVVIEGDPQVRGRSPGAESDAGAHA